MNKLTKKADIAIDMIFVVFITLVSITLLIGFFGTKFPGVGKDIYCKTFFHLYSNNYVPSGVRVEKDYCKDQKIFPTVLVKKQTGYLITFNDEKEFLRLTNESFNLTIPTNNVSSAKISISTIEETPQEVTLDIGNLKTYLKTMTLSKSNSPHVINFTKELNQILKQTSEPEIIFNLTGTNLTVHELQIEYNKYFPKDTLIGAAIDCWESSDLGKKAADTICYEITLPAELKAVPESLVMTEDDVTRYLIQQELCSIFPNDYTDEAGNLLVCGGEDRLEWNIYDLREKTNILVEYDAKGKKIRIS